MVATLKQPETERSSHESVQNGRRVGPSTVVVVGNGPVGFRLLEKLCEREAHKSRRLIAFGEEPRPAYDRVRLTACFGDETATSLQFADRTWYEEHGIKLQTDDPIVAIDLRRRTVRPRSGRVVGYDTLVLAIGSRPFVPPIDGTDETGVFVYRTIEDVERIRNYSRVARTAAVIGGGLLGLEAARALLDLGLETHVVEMASVLMPQQLDNDGAGLLRRMVTSLGVQVHLQKQTQAIRRDGQQRVLEFTDGHLSVDMVVIAAGIRPRDELARQAGIEIGSRGGIVVNDRLQTSDPNVFAIGECAVHGDTVYGLAAPGYHMADVVAANLSGEASEFNGSDVSTQLKLLGIDVSLCGDYLDASASATLTVSSGDTYRKLILRNSKLVGAVGVGPFPELPRVQEAIQKRRRVWWTQQRRFRAEGSLWKPPENTNVSEWPAGAIVCSCVGVSRGELTAARDRGCLNANALAAETKASTVCGSCRPQLVALAGQVPEERVEVPGWKWLLSASVATAVLVPILLVLGPLFYAGSVQSAWHHVDQLIRSGMWKQVSGFSLLGITGLALLLSLRKRWAKLRFLNFGWWRAGHGILGTLTLAGVLVHTGASLGSNLNFWLMASFLGLNFVGAATGIVTALESWASGELQRHIRIWRPRLTLLHLVCFWPFPVLIAFHIFSAYYL